MKKLVVYTCILGGKNTLHDPKILSDADYVCFTDDRSIRSKVYRVVYIPPSDRPLLEAKRYKLMPHLVVGEYQTSMWIDGSLQPLLNMTDYINRALDGHSLAFFSHPWRQCAYAEAESCARQGRWDPVELDRQMEAYRLTGFPRDYGLIRGGVIFRRHHDSAVKSLMADWWVEVNMRTPRDQLSFPFVAWRRSAAYNVLPAKDFEHYFRQYRHLKFRPGDDRCVR